MMTKMRLENMKIIREDFIRDLDMVSAGLSPREYIEQSSCFVFQDGMVMTFNDEVACRKITSVNITGAVQAKALMAILQKMDDPELKIRENEKGEIEFRGKGKGFGITKEAEIFLPIDKVETPKKWRPLPKEFTEYTALVQNCLGKDDTKFLLTCIHIHPEYIEACDNLQAMRCRIRIGNKKSILVRGVSLKPLASLGMDQVALTRSWIHFKNQSGLVYSCRRYDETYPSLDSIIEFDGHPIVIPKGIAGASDRASVFAGDTMGDSAITVALSNGVIRVEGHGISGWYREVKKVAYEGPSMRFLISPAMLKHISENYSEAKIGDNRLKVLGGAWDYVTVLGKSGSEDE
jgi:hypothetical protein